MGTTANDIEVIILSDDEDEAPENDVACDESSVYIVEPEDSRETEDLVVTFSRRAEVLPHARYDCPIHPFTAEDRATDAPLAGNQLICDQCFCYICDKLASSCVLWCQGGICHCNSHKRSTYWSNLRDSTVLGDLQAFNLTVSEVDEHLRRAGTLQYYGASRGILLRDAIFHQTFLSCSYTPVYELVSSFLYEADKQNDRAAAILRLGAAEVFIRHVNCLGYSLIYNVALWLTGQYETAALTLLALFWLVRFSLCVRPWTDILLVSVLKGQNISGVRKEGKKKDVLAEDMSVIFLRSELLQRQKRYRELCRYLRVVQSAEQLRDLIPFFMLNAPASRFTPQLFLIYFYIFKSATAPHMFCCTDCVTALQSQCWTSLLTVVNSLGASGIALPAPSPKFLLVCTCSRLEIQIFYFHNLPSIVEFPLRPVLPVLSTFQVCPLLL
uniref:Zgc:112980 n=1 Tax=Takifugu rubripes TaxID=31033 RepID=A0A3B5KHD5_TAKRU